MACTIDQIKKEVVTWQRCLAMAGLYPHGEVDGIMGPKTRAAAEAWESEHAKARIQEGEFDERTERNLATVCPEVAKAVRAWLRGKVNPYCRHAGLVCKVIEGSRTVAAQNALSKGVTKASGGNSFHNYGLAIDIGLFKGGEYLTGDREYRNLHTVCGDPDGMMWGGNWKSIVDTPHYQIAAYGSGISKVKGLFRK